MVEIKSVVEEQDVIKAMQDDIFILSSEIDWLVDSFKALRNGSSLSYEMVDEMFGPAAEASDETFRRWEDISFLPEK